MSILFGHSIARNLLAIQLEIRPIHQGDSAINHVARIDDLVIAADTDKRGFPFTAKRWNDAASSAGAAGGFDNVIDAFRSTERDHRFNRIFRCRIDGSVRTAPFGNLDPFLYNVNPDNPCPH